MNTEIPLFQRAQKEKSNDPISSLSKFPSSSNQNEDDGSDDSSSDSMKNYAGDSDFKSYDPSAKIREIENCTKKLESLLVNVKTQVIIAKQKSTKPNKTVTDSIITKYSKYIQNVEKIENTTV